MQWQYNQLSTVSGVYGHTILMYYHGTKEQFFKMGLKSYGYDGNDGFFKVASACNFIKSNNPPWAIFTFFKLCKWYQIAQSVSSNNTKQEQNKNKKTKQNKKKNTKQEQKKQVKRDIGIMNSDS